MMLASRGVEERSDDREINKAVPQGGAK